MAALKGPLTGRHVLSLMVGFFAIVLLANGLLAYYAVTTFSGTVAGSPYRQGRAYDDEIARATAQTKLNWQATIEHRIAGDGRVELRFVPKDADGGAISGLTVAAMFNRPAQAEFDRAITLRETETGLYRGLLELPGRGVWLVELDASRGKQRVYRSRNRIFVK